MAASKKNTSRSLLQNGPAQLEMLLQAIIFHPQTPILIADNDLHSRDASVGAGKLLGIIRDKVIGRPIGEFVDPAFRPRLSELWLAFLESGQQHGTLRMAGTGASVREIGYSAKKDVIPERHLLILHDKSDVPAWVSDYAIFLMDVDGNIASWYSGAERIYGYTAAEAIGRPVDALYPAELSLQARIRAELNRCVGDGHFGTECWCARKDGTRFRANIITMTVRDDKGNVQGFARVVRDFTARHRREQKPERPGVGPRSGSAETSIAGIISGEFDRIPEANEAFLCLVGYTRQDLATGLLRWPDLTPPEYFEADELAHEEGLQFGACTPFKKELIRKDGTRVPVVVTTAVLKLCPFRWITFIQDLSSQNSSESAGEPDNSVEAASDFNDIVGRSAAMNRLFSLIKVVAPTNATVLILGETGTGKELVARAIHRMSPRRERPFVTLNCAAIPTGLLESELFGYERGAFTGALAQKIGRFELAHRGTLFLDEVGDIPLELQPKLLRALQEKSFERLGGIRTIPIDVRLVAATNRNLAQMMGDKLFRSDLYYRLRVFPVTTPSLRDRAEDIPLLTRHFTRKYSAETGKNVEKIPTTTMKALTEWHWPGNVRELENFLERAVILSTGAILNAPIAELKSDASQPLEGTLEQIEREYVVRALREAGGVVSKAALRLGVPRTSLNALMQKLGITRSSWE